MARHRVECDQSEACPCWCHRRCGAVMRSGQTCYRMGGHRWEHQDRISVEMRRRRAA